MKKRFEKLLRRFVEAALRSQRYRYLRAQLWDDAVHAMNCESCPS